MLKRIKNAMNGVSFAWKYGSVIRSLMTAWSRYPGVESSEELRAWVRPLLFDVATLTALTPTPIDDAIAFAAIQITNSDHAWAAIHSLVLLGHGGSFVDGVLIPQDQQIATTGDLFDAVLTTMPENPTIVLSAVGLLLYLLRTQKSRK